MAFLLRALNMPVNAVSPFQAFLVQSIDRLKGVETASRMEAAQPQMETLVGIWHARESS
jgi:hypothetical protein